MDYPSWCNILQKTDDELVAARLRLATSRGRPLGTDAFIAKLETSLGRRLRPLPPGRPPKPKTKRTGNVGSPTPADTPRRPKEAL